MTYGILASGAATMEQLLPRTFLGSFLNSSRFGEFVGQEGGWGCGRVVTVTLINIALVDIVLVSCCCQLPLSVFSNSIVTDISHSIFF